jgi:hypothetical protein
MLVRPIRQIDGWRISSCVLTPNLLKKSEPIYTQMRRTKNPRGPKTAWLLPGRRKRREASCGYLSCWTQEPADESEMEEEEAELAVGGWKWFLPAGEQRWRAGSERPSPWETWSYNGSAVVPRKTNSEDTRCERLISAWAGMVLGSRARSNGGDWAPTWAVSHPTHFFFPSFFFLFFQPTQFFLQVMHIIRQ